MRTDCVQSPQSEANRIPTINPRQLSTSIHLDVLLDLGEQELLTGILAKETGWHSAGPRDPANRGKCLSYVPSTAPTSVEPRSSSGSVFKFELQSLFLTKIGCILPAEAKILLSCAAKSIVTSIHGLPRSVKRASSRRSN